MSKELVIGSSRHETKVAVLEDDQLVEVYFQRANEYSLAGSIHKGRVTRVLPGMQSAFVDLGLERDTFLYVSDFFEEHDDIDTVGDEKPSRSDRREKDREPRPPVTIVTTTDAGPEGDVTEPSSIPTEAAAGNPEGAERRLGRHEGERTFSGDRRNRRSRRRRQRGRGFPENKYAQPSAEPVRESAPSSEEEPEEPGEVIILPGESLAKYRQPEAVTVASSEDDAVLREPIEQLSEEEQVEAEEEAIELEAEELELADKVFAHHDDESPAAEERKVEEVKNDESPEPAPGQATGATDPDQPESVLPSDATEMASQESKPVEDPISPLHETDETDFGIFVDAPGPEEITLVAAEELAAEKEIETVPGEDTGPQVASVREPGGRYMHRASRRMRRRRGGNRFGQPSEFAGSGGGATAGAAAALEPELRPQPAEERIAEKPERELPSISDLLKPGQEIIVQIAKEPLGQKGARITSHVALPGRFVVFMPSVNHLGVSRKIASDEERQRLKKVLQAHRLGTTGGFIVRTAGEGVPEEDIAADMNFLYNLWLDIRQKAEKKPAPALLHYDLDIVQRILRDQVTEDYKAIWVDNEDMYENVLTFMQRFQPALVNRVKMYTRPAPIFDAFNITQELEKALRPKVWLKSGGYIVINQTEALVAIDINTGKYVGKSNRLEDTIVKTNTEAVKEIVRQIRLRDLGGIIVVDFIDMDERKNRQKVMQALEEAMRADKAPNKILQFNDFGLVAITRKRVKQSLERTLCAPCPYCEGAGYVKSVQTIIGEILVEAQKIARAVEGKDVILRVHPDVAKVLKASTNHYLEELEEILGRPVLVTGDPALHHEKFDLA
ncbi:MAG: Rne/Rng family ribonuclease [Acidobacteriaceae bacterium]|nr:Rne/Rng family ribonuclease [Acidobacteriaceae bacterium]